MRRLSFSIVLALSTLLLVSIASAQTNTFTGYEAGYRNTTGTYNTFDGYLAGYDNTSGYDNTFVGEQAGLANSGNHNTFIGGEAGYTGCCNAFLGFQAGSWTSGYSDIFIGYLAGNNNTTGYNDIYIGNTGPSSGTEINTIRIGGGTGGLGSQTAAYIAGIWATYGGGTVPVYVNYNGQLFGGGGSSLRFKEQVRDMGDSTNALMKLRPVSFLYKPEYANGDRTLQYGLIAEEVAKVYPELVTYDKDGQLYSVKYQLLAPMLLNEVQKQYRQVEKQSEVIETQGRQLEAQRSQIEAQRLQVQAQAQEIDGLKRQLQQQNASLQERLSKLESYVATQTQVQAASEIQPAMTASPKGSLQ